MHADKAACGTDRRQVAHGSALRACGAGPQRVEQLIELVSQPIDCGLAIAQYTQLRFRSFSTPEQVVDALDSLERLAKIMSSYRKQNGLEI